MKQQNNYYKIYNYNKVNYHWFSKNSVSIRMDNKFIPFYITNHFWNEFYNDYKGCNVVDLFTSTNLIVFNTQLDNVDEMDYPFTNEVKHILRRKKNQYYIINTKLNCIIPILINQQNEFVMITIWKCYNGIFEYEYTM